MITITTPGAVIFFPDEEITQVKAVTSGGLPAIAFKSASMGGTQFVRQYRTAAERDAVLAKLVTAIEGRTPARQEEDRDETIRILQDQVKELKAAIDQLTASAGAMNSKAKNGGAKAVRGTSGNSQAKALKGRAKQRKSEAYDSKGKGTDCKGKGTNSMRGKAKKTFIPPTDEEIIAYITEKEIDRKLSTPADIIAEAFRGIYEREEDTGEKDDNGFSVRRIIWRKANGDPVENWKSCLQTFKSRELMYAGGRAVSRKQQVRTNQFNTFQQNQYSEEELEALVSNSVQ